MPEVKSSFLSPPEYDTTEPSRTAALSDDQRAISEECDEIREMLLAKNRAYGSSAFEPVRIFSKASPEEQILVRIDDKLSRLRTTGLGGAGEDTLGDLIGYLLLLRVAQKRAKVARVMPREPQALRIERLRSKVHERLLAIPHLREMSPTDIATDTLAILAQLVEEADAR